MKKKWWAGIASALLLGSVLLTGCGSSSSEDTNLTDQGEFHYAMSGLYKPFNFKVGGELTGFDVEIGEALAAKMGMKPVPVTNPWETIIQGLVSNKYHAILGSMTVTEERLKTVNFTKPYYRSGAQIFVNDTNQEIKKAEDLQGKTIGVVKASTYKDLASQFTDNIVEYDSDLTALMDLPTGRLDAVITDQMVGYLVIKEDAVNIKDIGEPLTHDDQAIAVRKEDEELLKKLNEALEEIIEDGTYDRISEKWFGRSILGK
jgi:polar amino acid transport system substrate-binding protein